MAIDGIGKGVPPLGPAETGSVGKSSGTSPAFHVERKEQGGAAQKVEGGAVASPLERLRAGEIDVNGYVDLRVEDATKGLSGLSPAQLADIKSLLGEQLRTDPGLVDLVRTATGKAPSPPED